MKGEGEREELQLKTELKKWNDERGLSSLSSSLLFSLSLFFISFLTGLGAGEELSIYKNVGKEWKDRMRK